MINLELYRIFYVVATEKNITKASEVLNISQPAVTKHIKNLEYQIGTPLFIRTKKGVILNEYGEKIYLKVKNALTLLNESEKEISEYKELDKGTIRIGISTSLAKLYLMDYIESFHKIYANIIIDIFTYPTKDLIKMLKNGQIDIIIGKHPNIEDKDLDYTILGKTKYIFVASPKYCELKDKKVKLKDVKKYPLIFQNHPSNAQTSIEKYFNKNDVKVEPKMSIGSSNLLLDFVKIGYGIGYATKMYAQDYIDKGKIFEIDITPDTEYIDYGLTILKNNIMPSYCNKLIEYLKNDMI